MVKSTVSIRIGNLFNGCPYKLGLIEKRLLYHILLAVQKSAVKPEEKAKHVEIKIPVKQLYDYENNKDRNSVRNYRTAVENLRKLLLKYNPDKSPWLSIRDTTKNDNWSGTGYVTNYEYAAHDGLTVYLAKSVYDLMTDATKGYSVLSAVAVFALQSKYSQRFYEWCCQWGNRYNPGMDYGFFYFTPEELSKIFGIACHAAQQKQKIIDVAKREIKKLYDENMCDYVFDCFDIYDKVSQKRGRAAIIKYEFRVYKRRSSQLPNSEAKLPEMIKQIMSLFKICQFRKELQAELFDALEMAKATENFSRSVPFILQQYQEKKIANLGGYVRECIRKDLGIDVAPVSEKRPEKLGINAVPVPERKGITGLEEDISLKYGKNIERIKKRLDGENEGGMDDAKLKKDISLRSKYSRKFYKWCCQWGNKYNPGMDYASFYFTPEELNKLFKTTYGAAQQKQRIIDVAKNELKKLYDENACDYAFDCFNIYGKVDQKGGRPAIIKYEFRVYKRRSSQFPTAVSPELIEGLN